MITKVNVGDEFVLKVLGFQGPFAIVEREDKTKVVTPVSFLVDYPRRNCEQSLWTKLQDYVKENKKELLEFLTQNTIGDILETNVTLEDLVQTVTAVKNERYSYGDVIEFFDKTYVVLSHKEEGLHVFQRDTGECAVISNNELHRVVKTGRHIQFN